MRGVLAIEEVFVMPELRYDRGLLNAVKIDPLDGPDETVFGPLPKQALERALLDEYLEVLNDWGITTWPKFYPSRQELQRALATSAHVTHPQSCGPHCVVA